MTGLLYHAELVRRGTHLTPLAVPYTVHAVPYYKTLGLVCQEGWTFSSRHASAIITSNGGETMADDQTTGSRIKKRREEIGMSLNQLAEKSHVAKGYLWDLENTTTKDSRPSAETLFKVAEALGTSAADLLGKRVSAPQDPDVPPSLREFAAEKNLTESDVRMLAAVQYRGDRPDTKEDWEFIYESIRRTILGKAKKRGQS